MQHVLYTSYYSVVSYVCTHTHTFLDHLDMSHQWVGRENVPRKTSRVSSLAEVLSLLQEKRRSYEVWQQGWRAIGQVCKPLAGKTTFRTNMDARSIIEFSFGDTIGSWEVIPKGFFFKKQT